MADEEKTHEVVEFNDEEPETESEDTLEDVPIPPEERDVLWALTKPISEMTLEEQLEAVQRIRELRKVKLTVTKQKSELDRALAQLTPELASKLLKQLEALDDSTPKT